MDFVVIFLRWGNTVNKWVIIKMGKVNKKMLKNFYFTTETAKQLKAFTPVVNNLMLSISSSGTIFLRLG